MNLQTLTTFLMWCTIINGGLLILWSLICRLAPDLVFQTQRGWFRGSRETFDVVMYSFLGLFKILFLILNAVPFVVLRFIVR